MQVELREANISDLEALVPLFIDLYRGDLGPHFRDIVSEYLDSEGHLVMVALYDNNIVGVLVGSYRLDIDYECRAGFVDAIVVDKNFRGKGIGKKLLNSFTEWARDKNCTVLQVLTGKREFFEPRGFKERPAILRQVSIEEVKT